MTKDKYVHLDEFLEDADAHVIPEEFISAACVTYTNGDEYIMSFEEAAELMEEGSLADQGIDYIRAIIDMEVVREEAILLCDAILNLHAA